MLFLRWIQFHASSSKDSRNASIGILVNETSFNDLTAANVGYGFNASIFSMEELNEKSHDFELLPASDKRIYVHLDSQTMGIGGYDSWSPNVDSSYLIKPNKDQPLITKMALVGFPPK